MGMGIQPWKWEAMGSKVIPIHISNSDDIIKKQQTICSKQQSIRLMQKVDDTVKNI